MNNGDMPAAPILGAATQFDLFLDGVKGGRNYGLTKRETFAMAAMQGLMVNVGRNGLDIDKLDAVRDKAYEMADLMAEGQQLSTQEEGS